MAILGRRRAAAGSEEEDDRALLHKRLLGDAVAEEAAEDIDDVGGTDYQAPLLPGASHDDVSASSSVRSSQSSGADAAVGKSSLPSWLAATTSGSGSTSQTKKKKVRGVCPLCRQAVGSGSHLCASAAWRVHEGERSEAARLDGNACFRAGEHGAAAEAYSRALEHGQDDPKLWCNRAAAYTLLGEHERAMEDCEATIRLAPTWAKGYYRKALLLESRRDWEGAAAAYGQVLERCLRPEEGQAKAKRRLPVMRTRLQASERAAALPAPFAEAAVRRRWEGMMRSGLVKNIEDGEECRRRLEKAEEAKALGNEAVGTSKWEAARAYYASGLRFLGFCPSASAGGPLAEQVRLEAALRLNQALCEEKLGNHGEVRALCGEVLAVEPTSVKARFRRASALGELEDYDAALDDVELALALQPAEASLLALRQRLQEKRAALRKKEKAQFARMLAVR